MPRMQHPDEIRDFIRSLRMDSDDVTAAIGKVLSRGASQADYAELLDGAEDTLNRFVEIARRAKFEILGR